MSRHTVAVIGATGLVGRTMVNVLAERKYPLGELKLFASERSAGNLIAFKGKDIKVEKLDENSFDGVDIALFSAGKEVSKRFAPIAAKKGCIVIDNSSAWRMDENIPLVVPEVNPEALDKRPGIIANPNCSTIQMAVVLKPIHDKYKLKRVVVSTYQSISGAGQKGVDKLMKEINTLESGGRHRIAYNIMFHDIAELGGHSEEELKMINETRKILGDNNLKIAVTCVRLPVLGGHGESLNIETLKPFDDTELRELLANQEGLVVVDAPASEEYPTPDTASSTDPIYVGRIRMDDTVENGAYLWVVADNLRKGAATNAVQIAEYLYYNKLLG